MLEELENPEVLREEIRKMVAEVQDRDLLLFLLWTTRRISKNQPLPPPEQIGSLRDAFIRVAKAIRQRTKASKADIDLVMKWVGSGLVHLARPLARTVKFYREQAGLSRLQLSKRCRFPLRAILAIERAQVKDLALPRLQRLADGVGVHLGEFMDKIAEFQREENEEKEE
jgi:ribosome-binding protein aMBF1 (putative translation factor)